MLYDNAQYVSLLTRARSRPDPLYALRIEETIDYVLRETTGSNGCFTSSYDADPEGEEGKYYVGSEIERILSADESKYLNCL
jgi:uncharacterized protein YyaL (SSP411 family)